MKTRVTELLGVEKPIIQGGMAWVAESHLAAAVSEAGGFGLIGAANAPADVVRNYIREAKKLTDKPFGVNIMLLSPFADEIAQVVVEEGVAAVTTGAGNPEKYMAQWKAAGIMVIPVAAGASGGGRRVRSGHRGGRHCGRERLCGGDDAGRGGGSDGHPVLRIRRMYDS